MIPAAIRRSASPGGMPRRHIVVSVAPGASALTRMPCLAYVSATVLVRPITAHFAGDAANAGSDSAAYAATKKDKAGKKAKKSKAGKKAKSAKADKGEKSGGHNPLSALGCVLTFGTASIVGGQRIAGELFAEAVGIRIVNVPYKGTSPAVQDLLAGQVQLMFAAVGNVIQHIKSGRLKALGVTSTQRLALLPEVPALAETVPGFE